MSVRRFGFHADSVLCSLVLVVLATANVATICNAQGIGQSRLPVVDEQPLIQFAGALEFRLPRDWRATEIPVGREVRLVLAPIARSSRAPSAAGRIWLACHAPGVFGEQASNMMQLMASRVAKATQDRGQMVRTRTVEIAEHRGWQSEFVLRRQDHPNAPHIVGWHILLSTDNGMREVHLAALAALAEHAADVRAVGDEVLRSLVLRPKRDTRAAVAVAAQNATQILGAWKSLGSRFYLDASGSIAIQLDRPIRLSLDPNARSVSNSPPVIRGQFVAQGDVLQVTWNDGSRLNYRWSLTGGDLLLTDHHGNISQLRRLVH